jgi:hypothetical protein
MIRLSDTRYSSADLSKLVRSDLTQTEKIRKVFMQNPHKDFTADEMHDLIFDSNTPVISIRARMSTMAKQGILQKLEDKKRPGKYGIETCPYRLMPKDNQLILI